MVTYKTLEEWMSKCKKGLSEVELAHRNTKDALDVLSDQRIAVTAQIEMLETLMDTVANPPTIELPFAGDEIENLFEERLSGPEGLSPEEVHKDRQEHAYLREAMASVKDIDAVNREEQSSRENATFNT